jgi:spectinomycin phosphotransferase
MPAPTEEIFDTVRANYGVRLTRLVALNAGNDPHSQSFEGADETGTRFFVKQRRIPGLGAALSAALFELGNEPVVAPVRTKSGDIAVEFGTGVLLLYPFLDGKNGFERRLDLRNWQDLGTAVRRIHGTPLPLEFSQSMATESFEVNGLKVFDDTMSRLRSSDTRDAVEEALADVFRNHRHDVEKVIERTAALGAACRDRHWELVPSHADLHVGNVLVDQQAAVRIVDWDSPRLAPRECDLMFMCDGGIMNAHGAEEERSFFAGYGPFIPDAQANAYYRYARILEDLIAYTEEATSLEGVSEEDRIAAVRGVEIQFPLRAI